MNDYDVAIHWYNCLSSVREEQPYMPPRQGNKQKSVFLLWGCRSTVTLNVPSLFAACGVALLKFCFSKPAELQP